MEAIKSSSVSSSSFCIVYLAYIVSAFLVRPNWGDVIRQTFVPHFAPSTAYLLMIIAVIGTTISPWMQFYIQAAVVDKGIARTDYRFSRVDVLAGGIWTDLIAYFIIVSCAATILRPQPSRRHTPPSSPAPATSP